MDIDAVPDPTSGPKHGHPRPPRPAATAAAVCALLSEVGRGGGDRPVDPSRRASDSASDAATTAAAVRLAEDLLDGRALAGELPSGVRLIAWNEGRVSVGDEAPSMRRVPDGHAFMQALKAEIGDVNGHLSRILPAVTPTLTAADEEEVHMREAAYVRRFRHLGLDPRIAVDLRLLTDPLWTPGEEPEVAAMAVARYLAQAVSRAPLLEEIARSALADAADIEAELLGTHSAFRIVGAVFDLHEILELDRPRAAIEARCLNDALRPTVATAHLVDEWRVAHWPLRALAEKQALLSARLRQTRALGGDGLICPFALAAMDASLEGREASIRALSDTGRLQLTLPDGTGVVDASVGWEGGGVELQAEFASGGGFDQGRFILPGVLPETVRASMPGRPVGQMIALPFPFPEATVDAVSQDEWGLRISVDAPRQVISRARGAVIT